MCNTSPLPCTRLVEHRSARAAMPCLCHGALTHRLPGARSCCGRTGRRSRGSAWAPSWCGRSSGTAFGSLPFHFLVAGAYVAGALWSTCGVAATLCTMHQFCSEQLGRERSDRQRLKHLCWWTGPVDAQRVAVQQPGLQAPGAPPLALAGMPLMSLSPSHTLQ